MVWSFPVHPQGITTVLILRFSSVQFILKNVTLEASVRNLAGWNLLEITVDVYPSIEKIP